MSTDESGTSNGTGTPDGTGGSSRSPRRGRTLARQLQGLAEATDPELRGAVLLVAATLLALVWANSPWSGSYDTLWHTELGVRLGDAELSLDLEHWVVDGAMTFFFFLLGLEVKRELVLGALTDRRRALAPFAAAVAGMVLPALVFTLVVGGGEGAAAWGTVISTDTAFVLGVLALLGNRGSVALRVFILTLAVVDDVGALLVIAVAYTPDLSVLPLVGSALALAAMSALSRRGVVAPPPYVVLALTAWVLAYFSGVHPTLVGVVIALLTPAFPPRRAEVEAADVAARAFRQDPNIDYARAARRRIGVAISATERLMPIYRPWVAYLVLPLFALASAGVPLDPDSVDAALGSRLMWGVVAGLVVGKLVGVALGAVAAVRSGRGELAPGLTVGQVAGGGALCGMGFTISLLIVDLALDDETLAAQATVGVLLSSVLAAVLGSVILAVVARRRSDVDGGDEVLVVPVDVERDHLKGRPDAPLTLVEYGDYECPFCGRATGTVREVLETLGDRVRYVYRHAPVADVHPHAAAAAELAERAAEHGLFWEAHELLFRRQDALADDDLAEYAAALGLPAEDDDAEAARAGHRRRQRVRDDAAGADASGVTGTPTFFVNGRLHTGRLDAASLVAALRATPAAETEPLPAPPAGDRPGQ